MPELGSQYSSVGIQVVLWHHLAYRNSLAAMAQGLKPLKSRSGVFPPPMDMSSLQEHV